MAAGSGAPLRNPTGTSPLPGMQLRDAVVKMLQGGIGPHLRLFPGHYKSDDSLRPLLGSWKGDDRVTNDCKAASEIWTRRPAALVVSRCDNLVVLDVDRLNGPEGLRTLPNPWIGSLSAAQQEAMKTGLVAVTASGARHYIFRQPDDRKLDSSVPALGVDVKAGRGACVVLPPSFVQKRKKGYEGRHHWLDESYNYEAPPVLPDALANLLQELPRRKSPSMKTRTGESADGEKIGEGGRHEFLKRRAWDLSGRRLELPELVAATLAANLTSCDPPLPDDEARELAKSAFEKRRTGGLAAGDGADENRTARQQIIVSDRQLMDIIDDFWRVLTDRNDPPRLFCHGGKLARVVTNDSVPTIIDHNRAGTFGELIRAADCFRALDKGKLACAKPPIEVADDMMVNVHPDLPPLDAVGTSPIFDAKWNLLNQPGYHRGARRWLDLPSELLAVEIPDHPTAADVRTSDNLLRVELLGDFPFATEGDLAHAVAAILVPFARLMFEGPTPIHLIEAPVPGSGKSLLADLISIVCIGEAANATTLTRDEDEARKKLTALLRRGRPIISIDNLDGGLWSSQLASAITAERWDDRVLGRTEMVSFPNGALWLASGNNPVLSQEIARRCVRIRLNPKEEQPWLRGGFTHPSIREWALQHRADLVRAVLTIIRSWIWAGGPEGQQILGSFEPWSRTIGGMVGHLGLTGFLSGANEFYADADYETGEWSVLVSVWWKELAGTPVSVRDLMALAEANDLVAFACGGKSEQARRSTFGKALRRLRDRTFGDFEIVFSRDGHTKQGKYWLRRVEPELLLGDGGSK